MPVIIPLLLLCVPLLIVWRFYDPPPRKESNVTYVLRICDDATRQHPRLVCNHVLEGPMSVMRLKDSVFMASMEHSEAFVYARDGEIERCVASCHCGGMPCVSVVQP